MAAERFLQIQLLPFIFYHHPEAFSCLIYSVRTWPLVVFDEGRNSLQLLYIYILPKHLQDCY